MKNYNSLSDALLDLQKRGYKEHFETESFCLYCGELDMRLDPQDFKVDEEYLFEGDPNHEEDVVLIAVTAPNGVRGTLIDSYRAYSEKRSTEMANRS